MKTWKNKWMALGASILCLTLNSGSLMASTEKSDWLTTNGNKIVDQEGNEIWFTGLNWFGFNTETSTFDGIWAANLSQAIKGIANRGFNLIRIPVTTQLMEGWMTDTAPKPNVNTYVNPELKGMNSLQLFDETVRLCKENGIKIMLDIHSARVDGSRHFYPVWYEGETGIDDYHRTLEWFANRYKEEDTILAIDLKNEPHGKPYSEPLWAKWDDSTDDTNWKYAAEVVATKILDINPNLLVVIEGVEAYPMEGYDYTTKDEYMKPHYYYNWWGGNLRGVKDYPVELGKYQAQIVYSPHDYGPTVYNQSWFDKDFTKESLYEDCWRDNWAYIMEENIAPLLIGEWGGYLDGGKNQKWLEYLREYITENKIHHTFWCYNPNSGDTGGLVLYDFMTWDEAKYNLVEPALWQDEKGKFISIDHDIPLGTNGISLSEYLGKAPTTPENPNPAKQKGDVNEDGIINSSDYALLERYVDKKVTLSTEAQKNADTNKDGVVDRNDLLALEKYLLGDESAF